MGYVVTVEDEENIRENIIEILGLEGHDAKGFSNPADFLKFLENNDSAEIDLIITDIMMPGMSGIDMIKKSLSVKSLKSVPLIYLTALGDEKVIAQAYETCDIVLTMDYIVKPFQIGWFMAKIKAMVALKVKNEELLRANEEIMKTNFEIRNILSETDIKNEYLVERLKKLVSRKDLEVENKLDIVKDLIPKIAVNDLASLKFVARIVEKNQDVINKIVREATEEDEFFKILPKCAEPLRTAIWDIEQTIKLFISMGIIDYSLIGNIKFEETSFYEILLRNYREGGFSTEHFKTFIEDAKFKADQSDVILF